MEEAEGEVPGRRNWMRGEEWGAGGHSRRRGRNEKGKAERDGGWEKHSEEGMRDRIIRKFRSSRNNPSGAETALRQVKRTPGKMFCGEG